MTLWMRVAVLSLALAGATGLASAADDAAMQCDTLAASPYDPATPAGTGVPFAKIDADAAIAACAEAVKAAPDDARRQAQLGRAYDKANRTPEAIATYEAAIADGSLTALVSLGAIYEGGYGVPVDGAKALGYYQQAADAGLPMGIATLGSLYEQGIGVPQDYARAAQLYKKAADAGSGYGAAALGYLTEMGRGVPADEVEAARLYKIGADAGEDFALRNMGLMHREGRGGLAKDPVESLRYLRLAADRGMALAYLDISMAYRDGNGVAKDVTEAERYLHLALTEGNAGLQADAKNDLAWLYATQNIRLAEAEALSRESLEQDPEHPNRLDTLAWILHLQGKDAEALPLIEKALEKRPDDAEVIAHHKAIAGN